MNKSTNHCGQVPHQSVVDDLNFSWQLSLLNVTSLRKIGPRVSLWFHHFSADIFIVLYLTTVRRNIFLNMGCNPEKGKFLTFWPNDHLERLTFCFSSPSSFLPCSMCTKVNSDLSNFWISGSPHTHTHTHSKTWKVGWSFWISGFPDVQISHFLDFQISNTHVHTHTKSWKLSGLLTVCIKGEAQPRNSEIWIFLIFGVPGWPPPPSLQKVGNFQTSDFLRVGVSHAET